ncbi:MAG: hypothetical protein HYT72_00545 [Candidatus Aenigmarchaeota archaeon]|nr:hypothetical protein [Candidatus Aenigmarchaeota archaeon]
MIILSEEAKKKYAEMNSMAAKEIANGAKDTVLLDVMNALHDKYKVVQLYPNLGKPVSGKEELRKLPLMAGWFMLYIPMPNYIHVIDFVKEGT